ncbi:hypothetical protein [Streptomyces albireticuli]|uniref:Uncharacterized protein n=1 Tax=Streptomyces albireticuli TaxID=1940 RepID=A0A2A2DDF6_9ACTN|nr:hypothetical protein [Streptomyces albireticuli]MCD9141626.1 hypothetical protein [Streptomyces albireticuli]MCD9164123.1 hypothetical protein [Streptomyces albireticuli]MCD9189800.1 hypothetical protein [Streptomyces albireticuli]PAU49564.1 hypothetical protein CK936_07360 [Streptomyces albireticuli]
MGGTTTGRPIAGAFRALLLVGGVLLIAAAIVLGFFLHGRILDMVGTARLVSGLALRTGEFAVLSAGAWCAVRGWNGRMD